MKKLSISLIMIIIWCNASSQVFAGLNLTSKGIGLNTGAETKYGVITVGFNKPIYGVEKKTLFYSTLGYTYKLGEENKYNIGLHAGVTSVSYTVIKDNDIESKQKKTKPIFVAELGKDMGTGRLSIICNYVGGISYGFSMKVFFN